MTGPAGSELCWLWSEAEAGEGGRAVGVGGVTAAVKGCG